MRTMSYLSIVCGLLLMLPATSWSYEFECGYRITGFSGNGCPYGEVDSPGDARAPMETVTLHRNG